ncbi:MAG: T9SS type A sorting domain-containing protein [Bacteroidetes bacterium]|nr:T9SS type A sorting domain-containing protein [Bacteroidota bacterium]
MLRKIFTVLLVIIFGIPAFTVSAQIPNSPDAISVLGQTDFASGTSGLSDTKLNGPNGVAVDPFTGKVFVADRSNHRVLRWASDDALNSGAAAEAVLGQVDFTSNSSGLTAGKFNNPIGVHIDQQGRLWVGDFGNKRVLRFDNAALIPTGSLADGVLGQPDFTTNSNGNSAEKLGGPVGLYVDYTGTLWVSDWSNHRVVFYANAAALPNGSAANAVLGQADFGLAVSATTQTGMKNPNDVYVDIAGRLWVSDAANRRVLRFDNARNLSNGAPADGVLGQTDFNSDVSAVTQSGFTNLRFVAGDNSGRLYVIQENSHRIVVFEQAAFLPNGAPADYIWGQPDFNTGSAGNPVSASNYNTPRAMYVDEARGNIWVADYSNHRVIRYYFINSGQYQVQLLSPSGGESWAQQTVQQITWTSSLVDKVKIEFSENGGADYIILADSVSASEEVFNWLITSDLTTQAKIRISDISNPSISSESDLFSIVPLTNIITLISPDGFQQWEQNSNKFIMFTVENIDFLKIEFSINNGSDWTTIEENYPTSDGNYLWNLPDLVSDQCLVKLTDIVSGSTAISEYPFSIVEETEANQDIIFFSDSPTPVFYDPSWGTVTAPSTLEIIGSKWPVSTNYALIGNYSLKLNYKSVTGGNWAIAVASPGWLGHDFSVMDTLSIKVFSENGWSSAIMPFIYLEDLSNRKTEKIPLESLVASIEPNTWTELRIPVQVFIDNPLTADLTRIKTIFFGQHHADDTQHTIYLDDIRVEGEDINGNDRPVFVILGSSTAAGAGASGSATSWVGLFRTYVQSINPEAVVVNLAVGGFTTYHVMPTGFIPPSGRPMPSSNNNITRALTYNPWAIIINLPSNDAANNYSVTEQMENFETIINLSTSSEVDYRVTTTQPRNFTNPDQLQNLFAVRTAILDTYTTKAVNIFDELAQPDGTIKPIYNSGDGIHLNDAGHDYIYQEIIGSGVANVLSQSEINQDNKSEMFNMAYPNPAANFINFMFDLPKHSEVSINLYNTLGQKAIVIPSEMYSEGKQNISLNISTLPAGVYVYQISIRNSDFINTYGKTISVIK